MLFSQNNLRNQGCVSHSGRRCVLVSALRQPRKGSWCDFAAGALQLKHLELLSGIPACALGLHLEGADRALSPYDPMLSQQHGLEYKVGEATNVFSGFILPTKL